MNGKIMEYTFPRSDSNGMDHDIDSRANELVWVDSDDLLPDNLFATNTPRYPKINLLAQSLESKRATLQEVQYLPSLSNRYPALNMDGNHFQKQNFSPSTPSRRGASSTGSAVNTSPSSPKSPYRSRASTPFPTMEVVAEAESDEESDISAEQRLERDFKKALFSNEVPARDAQIFEVIRTFLFKMGEELFKPNGGASIELENTEKLAKTTDLLSWSLNCAQERLQAQRNAARIIVPHLDRPEEASKGCFNTYRNALRHIKRTVRVSPKALHLSSELVTIFHTEVYSPFLLNASNRTIAPNLGEAFDKLDLALTSFRDLYNQVIVAMTVVYLHVQPRIRQTLEAPLVYCWDDKWITGAEVDEKTNVLKSANEVLRGRGLGLVFAEIFRPNYLDLPEIGMVSSAV